LFKKPTIPSVATCYHTWWQQSHYIKSQFWKRLFIPFEVKTYRLADRIICISEDSRRILTEKYGIEPEKTKVITPGVDAANGFFPLQDIEKIPESVLYIGRVDKRKGVDFLVKAMRKVVLHLPGAQLFVGGTGKDLAALRTYSQANGLEKNVRFLGFIPDENLNLWYNRVECTVIPSVFEGFGLTAVEAMAAGTSVICTDVDSLRNIVEDGVSGNLVPYDDDTHLSAKIVTLLRDETMRRRFALEGRERVLTRYDWEVVIKLLRQELLD
jgi:glycosyltransferase involved in cell wall biosynthesis